MPALKLFNRRWLLASDDVPAPAAFLATFHFIWIVLLITWLAEIQGPKQCQGVGQYYIAVSGLLASFTLSFILEIAAVLVGLRGSIFETQRRQSIPKLIYANILAHIAQIAFNGYATHLIYTEPPQCPSETGKLYNPIEVLQGAVISIWCLILGLILFTIVVYNLFPNYKDPKQWERQCRCFNDICCGFGRRGDFDSNTMGKRLGTLFSIMFSHTDFTPTDVITSFLLALNSQRLQRRILNKLSQMYASRDSENNSSSSNRRKGNHINATGGSKNSSSKAIRTLIMGNKKTKSRFTLFPFIREGSAIEEEEEEEEEENTDEPGSMTPDSTDELLSSRNSINTARSIGMNKKSKNNTTTANSTTNGTPLCSTSTNNKSIENTIDDDDDDILGVVDPQSLSETAYYMKYAFAAYGWMLFVWNERTTGCLKLCCGRGCGMWAGVLSGRHGVPGINTAPYFNTEAILQAAHLKESDLIFVRQEGTPNVLPYFIALDHDKKNVVIAIRGSLSFDDVLRDCLYEPAALDLWLTQGQHWNAHLPPLQPATPSSRFAAHSGILEAARATMEDIRGSGHLTQLLLGSSAQYPEYGLVVCGHSLGAGCAFLLSLYLKNFFPNLRCFAFSPPGGLASADLCAQSTDWCTSVVCGKEMIPRMTLATFERMRDELVHAAAYCKMSKMKLLANWVLGRLYSQSELFYSPECLPEEPQRWLDEYKASLEENASKREYIESASKFGPPGKVMHLRPTGRKDEIGVHHVCGMNFGGKIEREYKCVWVNGQSLVEQGLLLSGRMMLDHFPDYCLGLLRRLADAAAIDQSRVKFSDTAAAEEMARARDGGGRDSCTIEISTL